MSRNPLTQGIAAAGVVVLGVASVSDNDQSREKSTDMADGVSKLWVATATDTGTMIHLDNGTSWVPSYELPLHVRNFPSEIRAPYRKE